jgi:hypothetical protein
MVFVAQIQINVKANLDLLNHISHLENTFQIISQNFGQTLEVYKK